MSRIKKILSNKDSKSLIENFFYLLILQGVTFLLPFITIPYLSRVLGVDGIGKIAFSLSIIVLFDTIVDWGFSYTATRDIAKNRDNEDKISDIFSCVMWAKILLVLISFLILWFATLVISKLNENQDILFVTFLMILGKTLFPVWFFQAMERMKYITILNVLSKVVFTIAIFVFIKEKSDFILQPLFTSLGFLLAGFISIYIILIKWKVKFKKPNFRDLKITIKGSFVIFLENFIPNIYNNFSIMLLGFLGGDVANGKLNAGTKFIDATQQLINVVEKVFFPFLARRIDKHDLYVKLILFISTTCSILLFVFAPLIIDIFYTPEFYDSINVLRILAVTIFFMSIRNAYGTQYMILEGYEKELLQITIWTSIIGFLLAFPLVYYFSFWGAAINIMFIKGLVALIVVLKAKKIKKAKIKREIL